MKRSLVAAITLAAWSGSLATGAALVGTYRTSQYHASLASQVCTAITPRVQAGGVRDPFDQAYAIIKISSRTAKSFVSLRNGAEEYGQRPPDGSEFQAEVCRVEGRPDFTLTFFFEKAPILGMAWLVIFGAIALLSILMALLFHVISSRLVKVVKRSLSEEMSRLFEAGAKEESSGYFSRLLETLLKSTPAIRKLQSELTEKTRLAHENSTFRSKVSNLLASNSKHRAQERGTAEIVGQVRHDLRSPLSFLRVFGQSLEKSGSVETYHLSVQKIERILEDLNQVAGAEMRSQNSGQLSLIECVAQETIAAKKLAWRPDVKITFAFDQHNLNLSPVDATRFARIMDNLLQNAYEAIGGSGEVHVVVKRSSAEVDIQISDTGRGIPEEVLQRLGAEQLTFGKKNGNGIGLLTAKQWIHAWGGELSIRSKEGAGTTISIRLPAKESRAHFVAGLALAQDQELVVVDDEPNVAESLMSHLGRKGKKFDSIASYAAWLDSADLSLENIFSVYDLHLKPGSGLDLLRLHPWPKRALLYTSDYLNHEALELSAELGFSIFPKVFLASS